MFFNYIYTQTNKNQLIMKTNQLLTTLLLAGGIFTINAQTIVETANLTSGGLNAGTGGGLSNTYYGAEAGSVSAGSTNTFIGSRAGKSNGNGGGNFFGGSSAGLNNINGYDNTYLGERAGESNIHGIGNTFVGKAAGLTNTSGHHNTYLGNNTGNGNPIGYYNIAIGATTAYGASGSNNIFIGNSAGSNAIGDNKLYIDNSNTTTPLIWGDFSLDQVKLNGKVGIGGVTAFPTTAGGANLSTYDLFVKGGILAEEVRVATTWADYVFANDYALLTLEEVELFISNNGHLPNVPSAKQVAEEGISLGDIARIQQEKIEELTLYIIEQNKQLQAQQLINEQFKKQENEIRELKALVQNLVEKK